MSNQIASPSDGGTPRQSAPVGDPSPLGFAGFAATLFLLGLVYAQVLSGKATYVVLPLALVYGGVAELLAGMWEFRRGNTFGAVAFTSYGAFWITYFVLNQYFGSAATAYQAIGYLLLTWTIFTAYMLIASMRTNGAVFLVFLTLTITLAVFTAGEFDHNVNILKGGGIVAIITAALSWYASLAGVVNTTWKKRILPVWPLDS
ncbi:MAG TPA: acetate uptake transporter [Acidimicrobiales bacterium]|nr:acetate uptake transporter [Acidimicrobiales bacterium]